MDADVIVVGAGAIGASTAYHLGAAGRSVLVLEKEAGPARHQSGRNSGVIHPGFNAKPGTLKARFCVEGSRRLRSYCESRGVPLRVNGIVVAARTEAERPVLAELERRAAANGVRARRITREALRELEPNAEAVEALHAPDGASFDSVAFVEALRGDAERAGVRYRFGVRVRAVQESNGTARVRTTAGLLEARAVVNCAGLQSDLLGAEAATDHRIVPFRGLYAELAPERRDLVRGHIYPAPDLAFPFLGVHFSRRTENRVLVGPGAMLAFGREAYRFHHITPPDLLMTLTWPGFWRLLAQRPFRRLVRREICKSLSLQAVFEEARRLLPALRPRDLVRSFAGNRAQVVHRDGRLVDDFLIEERGRVVHVLNAASPGLTCSLPFGEHVARLAQAAAQ